MKEEGTIHWNSPSQGATNSSVFTALSAGKRWGTDGSFMNQGEYETFWTSNPWDNNSAWFWGLGYIYESFSKSTSIKRDGVSTRCIKDR